MQTLNKNPVFPFDIDMCPSDDGSWFDGEELEQVVATVDKKTLRLVPRIESSDQAVKQKLADREISRIQDRYINQYHSAETAAALDVVTWDDLTGGQQILAFLGLPVESDEFYQWRSTTNLFFILVNTVVFAGMVYTLGSVMGLLGLFPNDWYMHYGWVPQRFLAAPSQWGYTLLTSMFIHGGIAHLLGNMFFLFTTGDDVENRLGHRGYLVFYLAAGVVANLAGLFTTAGAGIPHIGASGAIAGVMGAYMALCKHKSFYVWLFRVSVFGRMVSVSAWLYLLFWFAMQLLSVKFGNPGVDYAAHIAGFVFGFTVGKLVQSNQIFNGLTGQWEWGEPSNGKE